MTDIVEKATGAAKDLGKSAVDEAKKATGEQSLFDQARDAVTGAFDATVTAAKENPLAAAGIAAGTAAAVAGAAFGASKLLAKDEPTKK